MKPAFKILCIALLLCILQTRSLLHAEATKSAQALYSDFLYDFFEKSGFKPEKQLLQNTLSYEFPYNVVIALNKEKDKKKLIIAIPQQDIKTAVPVLTAFIQKLTAENFDYRIDFVFTANDYSPVPTADELNAGTYYNAGSLSYIENLETKENTAAFLIRLQTDTVFSHPKRKNGTEIIPGGRGEYGTGTLIPRPLFTLITDAFYKADINYYIKDSFLSLYRLGLTQSDPLISTWLTAHIPAVMFKTNAEHPNYLLNGIEQCIRQYASLQTVGTETHYSIFRIFNRTLWISEKTYIVFLSLAAALTLCLFFIFSFIRGAHRYIHREEFFKTWYLIPLTIGVTALLLFFAQFITAQIIGSRTDAALFFLSVKTVFAVTFFVFGFFPLIYYIFKLPLTGFIYGYLLSVAGFLNIFLFAAIDITLILLFIFEYIIIYISRTMRKVFPLIGCMIFMLLPFAPFINALTGFNSELCFRFISGARFGYNILFAAILLPFLIMIVRILIRFKLWKRRGSEAKSKIRMHAVFAAVFFVCFFTVTFAVSFVLRSVYKNKNASQPIETKAVSLIPERIVQFERSIFTLKLSSKLPVIRYRIEVRSQTVLPVLESNYPYDMFLKPFTAVFALDDYPPEPFTLSFSAQGINNTVCAVTAYIKTETGIQTEKLSYTITGVPK
ncbi:hypothetical protein H0R92_08635 [Treponema sp. OMZ 840]|uniref:hypothetical protein n=1 Tax=Treponema sp. OMZ 840 TaxID=244313 RepID=UPI003D929A05